MIQLAKTKGKIKISFIGEAAKEVTGSMILVESSNKKILIECGLHQSCRAPLEDYKINNEKFDFRANQIDYVFLAHNHVDHIGRTPLLFKRGGSPRIIGVSDTKSFVKILWEDSAKIMESDAIDLSKKFSREYEPIYDLTNVEQCLKNYEEYPLNEIVELDEFVKFQFIPSGHIINSAQLILWIKEGNLTKKIVYTSDLGNIHVTKFYSSSPAKMRNKNKPNNYPFINKADIFIGETTYAGTEAIASKGKREKDIEKLKNCITETCIEQHSRVMIPVFAMDRCQNMLTHLYNIFGKDKSFTIPVYVDSPMAIQMCKEYSNILKDDDLKQWQEVLSWKNVQFISDSEMSRTIRDSKSSCVVLASSGMIVAKGRSAGWCCSMLPRVTDRIIFCGYSAEGSIGAIIKEGKQKTITISGHRWANKCQVTNLTTFTSHIQRDTLLEYYGQVEASKIVLVHGDMDGKTEFAKELKKELSKNNLTSQVVIAQKDIVERI